MSDRRPHSGLTAVCSPTRRVAAFLAVLLAAVSAWSVAAVPSATASPATGDSLAAPASSAGTPSIRDVTVTASARVHSDAVKRQRLAVRARMANGRSYSLLVRINSRHRVAVAIARDARNAHTTRLTRFRPLGGTVKAQALRLRLRLRVKGQSPVRLAGTVTLGSRHISVVATDRSRNRIIQAGAVGVGSTRAHAVSWSDLQTRAGKVPAFSPAAGAAGAPTTKPAAVTGKPYLNQQTQSWKEYAAEKNMTTKRMYYNIASTATATWLNGASTDAAYAKSIEDSAVKVGTVPQFVLYAIPGRDCGGYSSGGAGSPAAYRSWVSSFAAAIGSRPAIVIVEPDAISFCNNNSKVRTEWTSLLTYAAKTLHDRAPNTTAYLHAGSGQLSYAYTVSALRDSGIQYLRGFAMNVSSIKATSTQIAFGDTLVTKLKAAGVPNQHYVIDTSRNGVGSRPNPGALYGSCNNMKAALGSRPTTQTASNYADAYLWIKPPGSSDGTCHSGDPRAGGWFPAMAQSLANNAVHAQTLNYQPLP